MAVKRVSKKSEVASMLKGGTTIPAIKKALAVTEVAARALIYDVRHTGVVVNREEVKDGPTIYRSA